MHRHLQAVLAERTMGALHRRDGHIKHFGDVNVAQLAALLASVSRQQDLRTLSFARRCLAGFDDVLQLFPFLGAQMDAVFLGHAIFCHLCFAFHPSI
jgi:hypothetical protein